MIKKKTKKNRIIITLCAMFIAFASVFSFVSFNKQDDLVVKADTVTTDYVFSGSPIILPYTYNNNSTPDTYLPLNNNNFGAFKIDFTSSSGVISNITIRLVSSSTGELSYISENFLINYDGYTWFSMPIDNTYVHIRIGSSSYDIYGDYVSFNFSKCSYLTISANYGLGGFYSFLRFYDIDGNILAFSIVANSNSGDLSTSFIDGLTYSRTYYFGTTFDDNQFYDFGFDAGYSEGYNVGSNDGFNNGYNDGYDIGHNVGYNNGYTAGSEDSNQYTFLNLVSATIDAPIKYFQSLFNFELLGVNLQGFLTGLFTLCVIVTIIKMVL